MAEEDPTKKMEQCQIQIFNSSTTMLILSYIGGIFLALILLKLLYKLACGIYLTFLAPLIGLGVNWKKLGRWAVVTGSTDGIGKAYAFELARKGLDIVLISRNPDKLKAVAAEIESKHKVETKTIAIDFTSDEQIYEEIRKHLHGLEIGVLVNNVGLSYIYPEYFCLIPNAEQSVSNLIKANIISCTRMVHLVLPDMESRRKGVIINVSSLSAMGPVPLLSVYSATKVFVDYFSRGLQVEYKKKGIVIQCLLPAFVATKMSKMRPNFNTPTPEVYVKWAIKTVGLESQTCGYPPHKFRAYLQDLLTSSLPESLVNKITFNVMSGFRKRYYKKFDIKEPDSSKKVK